MKVCVSWFFMLCSLIGHAESALNLTMDVKKPTFIVQLPGNPTTGYQWSIKSMDNNVLRLINSTYIGPQTRLLGAGGTMQFTFSPQKGKSYPKTTQIQFLYARPWEPQNGNTKIVNIQFK